MEEANQKKIGKALKLIKDQKLNEARNLLLEVLNIDSENDHSWYLLCFTLPTKERQIYALRQALKINPDNQKAKLLLFELQKDKEEASQEPEFSISDSEGFEANAVFESELQSLRDIENDNVKRNNLEIGFTSENEPEIPSYMESQYQEEAFDDELDLLSKRMSAEDVIPGEVDSFQNDFDNMDNNISDLRDEIRNKAKKDNRKSDAQKRIKKIHKKLPETKKRSTRRIMFILLFVLFSAGGYFLYSTGFFDSNIEDQINAFATDIFSSTSTPESTNAQIPQTATIVPAITETTLPTETRAPIASPTPLPTATVLPLNIIVEGQINIIQDQIENLRGLTSKDDVSQFLVSLQYLRNVLKGEFENEVIMQDSVIESEVLQLLGLNNTNYSLATHAMNAWVEARGGLYVPGNDAIFFTGLNFNGIEKYIYAQEYLQFLVDQSFGIESLGAYPACFVSGQSCQAAQALIKGDALLLSKLWAEGNLSVSDQNSIDNLFAQNYLIPASLPPAFSSQDLNFFNSYGLEFVEEIYEGGGWGAVNSAYLELPTTTEQIMHPIKYLLKEGAIELEDASLNMILGDEWEEVKVSDLGEWRTYLLLAHGNNSASQLDDEIALDAAKGWGGDEYQYYKNAVTGESVISVHWVMDTEVDAAELSSALVSYLNNVFGSTPTIEDDINCWENRTFSCVQFYENEVFWVQAPGKESAKSILELYLTE